MGNFMGLTALIEQGKLIVTSHRGFSACYPENTLLSEEMAIQNETDMLEFDLHLTADGVPVVLHDDTIDRTSDGLGKPEEFTFEQIRKFNFAYPRRSTDFPIQRIPSFEEFLKTFRGRAGMNIQLALGGNRKGLLEVCRLYCDYEMFDQGYLTIDSFDDAEAARKFNSKIECCMTPGWLERASKENLEKCAKFGCRFVQPVAETVTSETFELCRKLGLTANVFFADEEPAFERLVNFGTMGILTNNTQALVSWLKKKNLR